MYGGPIPGDDFGQIGELIHVGDNGSFRVELAGRDIARCGAQGVELAGHYRIGVSTSRNDSKPGSELSEPQASTVFTLANRVPNAVRDRLRLPACGLEVLMDPTGTLGADVAGRECLWNTYQSGSEAEFISTRLTDEGDPYTIIFRVLATGSVEIFFDNTRDPFGSGTWERIVCAALDFTDGDFVWDSCIESELLE